MADWVGYVRAERGLVDVSTLSIEAAYYALYAHEDWIGRQEWVADLNHQARAVLGQLRAANGDKPPTRIGTCPECGTGTLTLSGGLVGCNSCPYKAEAAALIDEHYNLKAAA